MKGRREGLKEGLWESLLRHLVHQYSSDVADHCQGRLQLCVPYCTLQLLMNRANYYTCGKCMVHFMFIDGNGIFFFGLFLMCHWTEQQ